MNIQITTRPNPDTQPPPAEKPATKKLQQTHVAAEATAWLPSKPTPPAESREFRNGFYRDRGNYNECGNNRENSDGHQGGNRVAYVVDGGGGGLSGVNERAPREENGKNWSSKGSRGRGGCGGGRLKARTILTS
ncbi:hypothetical protein AXG93_3468s1060 [Marchantia polymorpha subsp. ruderalis]|uniref:Uncharacterized protein n=1 Tax=Marchantia polymorpha subsp. ruderalis TaxID=1480154 RepID=A0A176WJV0_MARPO|nr:hypothetical protein AXG93_3468s1060 [Marchantia polymorpha subsp. ruderalis]